MSEKMDRRDVLKIAGAAIVSGSVATTDVAARPAVRRELGETTASAWGKYHDRVWIGEEYWANPMEDWCLSGGWAECLSNGANRSVHSLTRQLNQPGRPFELSVSVRSVEVGVKDAGASIRLGIKSEINEYRSNCFAHKVGIDAGIVGDQIILGKAKKNINKSVAAEDFEIVVQGEPDGNEVNVKLQIILASTGELIGSVTQNFDSQELLGNVALVSNFSQTPKDAFISPAEKSFGRFAFRDWKVSGAGFSNNAAQKFGPILWSMYTLSDSRSKEGYVLKLSAFTGPLAEKDNHQIDFQIEMDGNWKSLGKANLEADGWVATFRFVNWNERSNKNYRLVYRQKLRDGSEVESSRTGVIRANPSSGELRMAAMTCQKDYAFPYQPVAANVAALDPDILFFSGDQIYEDHGGFGLIRAPADRAILNYLRKLYQFGWAFGDVMRDRPTVCLPDDHDVLQGNLWGEGGADMGLDPAKTGGVDKTSGYIEPVRVLNAIHRTQTGHHPDPHTEKTNERGLSSYFGELVYGDVGFAILADRQWKSGPERIDVTVGSSGQDEEPDYVNPDFDRDDLHLLGASQEEFLRAWSKDWRNHSLKAVLSQTVFAGISTHQPRPDRYLKYDFDSSGWPASGRNRAIEAMRDSMALHICGDTHLGTLSQYGVRSQRDGNWAFCTPAIAAGWPRWWLPDKIGLSHNNRPNHGLPNTGEYQDSFGNHIYVYAVGNPVTAKSKNRYERAHEKGSGFGFVTFDTNAKTYTLEAFRFLTDVTTKKPNNQFAGWPVTIHQQENSGHNKLT